MYAIIRTGGKQSKVQEGDVLDVERLRGDGEVTFTPLLVVSDDGTVISGRDNLADVKVVAKVLGPSSGPKIDIFKYKAKTGYRRRQGHRQKYTQIEVTSIEMPGKKKPAAKKAPAKKPAPAKKAAAAADAAEETAEVKDDAAAAEEKEAKPAAKKAPAKKPAAKKPAAKKPPAKKPAAKKPAAKKPAAKKDEPADDDADKES